MSEKNVKSAEHRRRPVLCGGSELGQQRLRPFHRDQRGAVLRAVRAIACMLILLCGCLLCVLSVLCYEIMTKSRPHGGGYAVRAQKQNKNSLFNSINIL